MQTGVTDDRSCDGLTIHIALEWTCRDEIQALVHYCDVGEVAAMDKALEQAQECGEMN